MNFMVDIETLGKAPGCAILSIGAVAFTWDDPKPVGTFYRTVSLASCKAAGLVFDPDTVAWWQGQDQAAREAAFAGPVDLATALGDLREFIDAERLRVVYHKPDPEVWARDPDFDCVILEAAYRAIGSTEYPWPYNGKRALRTLVDLATRTGLLINWPSFEGVKHHALHDALHQAKVARAAYHTIVAEKPRPGGPWGGEL